MGYHGHFGTIENRNRHERQSASTAQRLPDREQRTE